MLHFSAQAEEPVQEASGGDGGGGRFHRTWLLGVQGVGFGDLGLAFLGLGVFG